MNTSRSIGVAFLLTGVLITATSASAQTKPVPFPDALLRMNDSVDALTKKVWPSVVQIMVTSYGALAEPGTPGDASMIVGNQQSMGSGFVIDPDGYIMTNAHVVNNAQRVRVILPPTNADGSLATALSPKMKILPARIVGITTELDLALLKVDEVKLPALPLATYSELRQGSWVFAFGSPVGLRNSLTHGVISAVARQTDPDSPQIYVQTDAPINPGNSGGPLVNVRGEVVGINTFIMSPGGGGSDGLGFAIPSATVRTVFKQLKQYGYLRRQEVGMSLQTITPDMAAGLGLAIDHGVIVSDVWPRGPAEAAGLQTGDVLVSLDGQPAENLPTVNYYFRLRDSTDPVQVVFQRGDREMKVAVTAVEQRSNFDSVAETVDPKKNLVAELGIIGVEIDPKIVNMATGLRDPFGVIVIARTAGSAMEVPLIPRDVIRTLNGKKVFSLDLLRTAIASLKKGTPVTLQIQREERLMFVSFVIE